MKSLLKKEWTRKLYKSGSGLSHSIIIPKQILYYLQFEPKNDFFVVTFNEKNNSIIIKKSTEADKE